MLGALVWLAAHIRRALVDPDSVELLLIPGRALAVSAALLTVGYVSLAAAWLASLRALGATPLARVGIGIYLSTQIAKYLPGNVAHYFGRIALTVRLGVPASVVALSVTLEVVLAVAAATIFAAAAGALLVVGTDGLALMLAAALCVVALALAAAYAFRSRLKELVLQVMSRQTLPWICLSFLLTAIAVALTGSALYVLLAEPAEWTWNGLGMVIGVFSASWLAGIVSIGVPAGIGVREVILVQALGPLFGAAPALAASIAFRLLTTCADVVALVVGYGIGQKAAVREPG